MHYFIEYIAGFNDIIIFTFSISFVILWFFYRFYHLKIRRDIQIRKIEFENILRNSTEAQNKVFVEKALDNIPEGVDEDKFFKQLSEELDKVKYLNYNNPIESDALNELLKAHHKQALQHSGVQFWFSITAAVIGFGVIIFSFFTNSDVDWYDYILKTLPGAVMETVSVLFINQSRETRERATTFFKELNYEKQIARSVAIADTIEDREIQARVKSQISLHIIGIKEENEKR